MNFDLKWPLLAIFAFLLEAFIFLFIKWFPEIFPKNLWLLSSIQYIMLFVFIGKNSNEPSIAVMGLGMLSNFFAISFNGGRMPVTADVYNMPEFAETVEQITSGALPEYFILQGGESFWFMGDVIPIPILGIGIGSIGDIILAIGVFMLVQKYMMLGKPKRVITVYQRLFSKSKGKKNAE